MRPSAREDRLLKRLDALGALLKVVLWPAVVGLTLLYFGPAINNHIVASDKIDLKGGPGGIEIHTQKVEAAVNLGAASATAEGRGPGTAFTSKTSPREIASAIEKIASPENENAIRRTKILWVDDNPENNRYEFDALQALGFSVEASTSTEDALAKLRRSRYDLVISDIKREPNNRAGFELLSAMRQRGNGSPVIYYTGSAGDEQVAEAAQLGAVGVTGNPEELLTWVGSAMHSAP